MYNQLLSECIPTLVVQPYAGGTTLRWWYNLTLVVQPYSGGTTLHWRYHPMLVVLTPLTLTHFS